MKIKFKILLLILVFFASPLCASAKDKGLNLSCTSDIVKSQFSCDTLKIVEKHLNDFDATNYEQVIASYGGFENYAKSLGGIFGEYYGKKMPNKTEADFQRACEYVLGWMYMFGWDYSIGWPIQGHTPWGENGYSADAFYAHGGFEGTYIPDHNFYSPAHWIYGTDIDHIISGKNGGVGRMASACGDFNLFVYNKLGLEMHDEKRLETNIRRLKDLKVGDKLAFFGDPNAVTDDMANHLAQVGEVYDDRVVVYDGASNFQVHKNYKHVVMIPKEDTEEADRKAMKDTYGWPNSWIGYRFYEFIPSPIYSEEKVFCELCTKDEDDPLYKKERQFFNKIRIIKNIFGDRIDEVVLASTVLHRYGQDYVYNAEYTSDFNEDSYRDMWTKMLASFSSTMSKLVLSDEDIAKVKANEKIDLLTLATIVMLDSNDGVYSDVCYKDGLAGDGLVGNTNANANFAALENGLFCGVYEAASSNISPLDFVTGLFNDDSFLVTGFSKLNRYVNIRKVCDNGYIGGLYPDVVNVKDKDKKKKLKEQRADEIIDYANYYKFHYGTMNEDEDYSKCVSNMAGVTGDFASWRQTDNEWKNISLGGSSSVGNAGCLVTSISMQISRSGTKLGSLPKGFSDFNPGAFVTSLNENGGFAGGGNFAWSGQKEIAPNFEFGEFVSLNTSSNEVLYDSVSKELSTGYGSGNYQKYLVLQISHLKSNQHWVAVNGAENGEVTIFDPASSGTTLDDNYNGWVVHGYRIMYATDVPFGQSGVASNQNSCSGSSSVSSSGDYFDGLASFIRYVEGDETCNYRGKGDGTGYASENLGDGAGATTALGITEYFDAEVAKQIGYTDFISDIQSGCTDKESIDKMFPVAMQQFIDYVDKTASDLNLNEYEKYILASIGYGGFNLTDNVVNSIRNYGKESEGVYNCFKSWGCGFYGQSRFSYGLSLRRMAEYEIFRTGNFNAAKPDYLGSYDAVQGLSLKDFEKTWPTKRDTSLWDGEVSDGSSSRTGAYCENGSAAGSPLGSGNLDFSCTSDIVKSRFSCETLKIVEKHLYDFDATNYEQVIASYGGFENYAKSVGGIFGEYYGKKMPNKTVADFQRACEYVLGWMYMFGWDYSIGWPIEGHTPWGENGYSADAFYAHGGFEGTYIPDHNFYSPAHWIYGTDIDHIISGKNGGVGRMASACGDFNLFVYNKLGLEMHDEKRLDKNIRRLKDLRVGDILAFFGNPNAVSDDTANHLAQVGEVYSDRVVVYDGASNFQVHKNYKHVVKIPKEDTEEADRKAMKDTYGWPNSWVGYRHYIFK